MRIHKLSGQPADQLEGSEADPTTAIRARMNRLDVTHQKLADHLGCTQQFVTQVLGGDRPWPEGMYERAEAKCREFLRFHPKDIQSLEILGWIHTRQEEPQKMLDVYTQLTRIAPENTAYWAPVIQHSMAKGDYEHAGEVLKVCLEHNPHYAYANIQYGQVLIHSGNHSLRSGNRQDALRLFSEAKTHLERAKTDDRYTGLAAQLIDRVERSIGEASAR